MDFSGGLSGGSWEIQAALRLQGVLEQVTSCLGASVSPSAGREESKRPDYAVS